MTSTDPLDTWRAALQVQPGGDGRFTAHAPAGRRSRLFGGMTLGQAVMAAAAHLDRPDMEVRSLHASFLRAGSPQHPVELIVGESAGGRTLAALRVEVRQGERLLIDALIRFRLVQSDDHSDEVAPKWPSPTAPQHPEPTSLPTFEEHIAGLTHLLPDWAAGSSPIDVRYVAAALGDDHQTTWLRARETIGDARDLHLLHACALIYATDMTMLGTATLPLGRHWAEDGISMASLDHTMWFHRSPRADEWHAFEQRVEAVGGGAALVSGELHDRAGRLVATVVQDGVVRIER